MAATDVFAHDPVHFSDLSSDLWSQLAARQGYTIELHPYVQTPLWAWSIQPLCTTLGFTAFRTLFLVLGLLSLIGMVEIAARAWAPSFRSWWRIALLLAVTFFSMPFVYAYALGQTHAEILFLSMLALFLSERGRPYAAGAALALAAAIKITPIFLVLYWMAAGRWREAIAAILVTVLLSLGAVAFTGVDLTLQFIAALRRVSDIWLLSFNNQSIATLFASPEQVAVGVADFTVLPLPLSVKLFCLAWTAGFALLTGYLARAATPLIQGATALTALVATSLAAPIAWSHYYLFLIPACMVLLEMKRPVWIALAAVIAAFNCPPIALDQRAFQQDVVGLLRSHVYSGLLAIGGLLILTVLARRVGRQAIPPAVPEEGRAA